MGILEYMYLFNFSNISLYFLVCRWLVPGGSDGKESACSAGDLGLIPGLGRSLEEDMATHSSILALGIPVDRGAWQAAVHGVAKCQTRLSD